MPLTEKASNSVKKNLEQSKPKTPARTTKKNGSSNTKENNQTLLTGFFKSTPIKNVEKVEIKKDENREKVTRTSPRIKPILSQAKSLSVQSDNKNEENQKLLRTSPRVKTGLSQTKTLSTQIDNNNTVDENKSNILTASKSSTTLKTNSTTPKKSTEVSTSPIISIKQDIKVKSPPKKSTEVLKIITGVSNKSTEVSTSSEISIKQDIKVKSPPKKLCTVKMSEQGTNCDLDKDMHDIEDEGLIKELDLTKEELELKVTNNELFWEQTAEKIREKLSDGLEDNKQLFEIQHEMENESKDLLKQQDQLTKLADEAGDICREFMVLDLGNDDEVDDSGLY